MSALGLCHVEAPGQELVDANDSISEPRGHFVTELNARQHSRENEDGTGGGIVNALNTIVQNNADAVVNMSFGFGEYQGPSTQFEYTQAFHNAISQGSAQGVTFVASTGDLGLNHCAASDFSGGLICSPASDPLVVAVGGLSPFTQNNYGDAYEQSYAWSGTGGGTSQYFSKGPSQANVCGHQCGAFPTSRWPPIRQGMPTRFSAVRQQGFPVRPCGKYLLGDAG